MTETIIQDTVVFSTEIYNRLEGNLRKIGSLLDLFLCCDLCDVPITTIHDNLWLMSEICSNSERLLTDLYTKQSLA